MAVSMEIPVTMMQSSDDRIVRTIHKTDSITIVKDLLVADSPPLGTSGDLYDSQDDLSIRPPSSSISIGNGGTSSGESTPEPTLITRTSSGLLTPPSIDSAYGINPGPSPPPVVFVTPSALSREDMERRRQQAKEGDVSIEESLLSVSGPLRVPDSHFGKAKRLLRKENVGTLNDDVTLHDQPLDDVSHVATYSDDVDDVTDCAPDDHVGVVATQDKSQEDLGPPSHLQAVNDQPDMDQEKGALGDTEEKETSEITVTQKPTTGNGEESKDLLSDQELEEDRPLNNNDFITEKKHKSIKTVKFYSHSDEEDEEHEMIKMRKTPYRSPDPDDYAFESDDENDDNVFTDTKPSGSDAYESTEKVKMIEELDNDENEKEDRPSDDSNYQTGSSDIYKKEEDVNLEQEKELKSKPRQRSGSGVSHHSELTEEECESGADAHDTDSSGNNSSRADYTDYPDSTSDVSLDEHLRRDSTGEMSQPQEEDEPVVAVVKGQVIHTTQSAVKAPNKAKATAMTSRRPLAAGAGRRQLKPSMTSSGSERPGRQPRPPWRATNLAPRDLESVPRLRLPKSNSRERSPVATLYTEQRMRLSPSVNGCTPNSFNGSDLISPSMNTSRQGRNPAVPIQLRSNAYVDNGKLCITLKGPSRALPDINQGSAGDKGNSDSVPMDVKIMFIRDDKPFRQKLHLPPLGSTKRRAKSYSPSPDRNILQNRAVHAPFNTRVEPKTKTPGSGSGGKERLSRGSSEKGKRGKRGSSSGRDY